MAIAEQLTHLGSTTASYDPFLQLFRERPESLGPVPLCHAWETCPVVTENPLGM